MEVIGTYPSLLLATILAVLGKPEGGFRPIALLPTPSRVFSKLARREVKQWERENRRSYHYGVA
eukprot:5056359-Pyramimonas_sp.AAC.1